MQRVWRFLTFWYDFIVGDDWTVAVGVLLLLVVSGVLAHSGLNTAAVLLMPVGVMALLGLSLRRCVPR